MSSAFKEWLHYKERVQHFQQCLIGVEAQIYNENKLKLKAKPEGTVDLSNDCYTVKVTNKITRTINQKEAEKFGGVGLVTKYAFSKTEYNRLPDSNKAQIDNCMTTKPGKPGFKVEVKDENR